MSAAFLSAKKLSGLAIVQTAARHNLREIQAELGADSHIDPAKTCHNLRLAGPATAAAVAALADDAVRDAGILKLRKDAVRAVELVIALPAGARVDINNFFADALAWVRGFFPVPVLSAVLHLDEAAPHLHVLLLPLQDNRMVGSDLVGNRTRLQAMQAGFFDAVAGKHGLTRPKAEGRLSRTLRDKAARLALDCLQAHPERLQLPDVRTALVQAIAATPEQLLAALGLEMPASKAKPSKTFAQIMTKPCKAEPRKNPIGFGRPARQPESEPYHCVGFASSPLPLARTEPANEADIMHVLDADLGTIWDEQSGEFVPVPAKPIGQARAWAQGEFARLNGARQAATP